MQGGNTNVGGSPTTTSVGGDGGTGAVGGSGANGGQGGDGGSGANGGQGGDGGDGGAGPCDPGPNDDVDGDGYSISQGDCDDCNARVGPNSIEILGNAVDEDCDGSLTNTLATCDDSIVLDEADPVVALGAIELCKTSTGPSDWGVVSAAWVLADGSAPPVDATQLADFHLGHGVMDNFGPNVSPRAGARLLALSNDQARRPTDPNPVQSTVKGYTSPLPAGFPKSSATCPAVTVTPPANDPIALQAVVRTPQNATGLAFDFDVYAADYPIYICSEFDDTFAAILSPIPAGLLDGNITFNAAGDPFSVNGSNYEVCGCDSGPPCMAGGKTFSCSLGTAQLLGTGFGADTNGTDDAAATGWQHTTAPVPPGGELTIRFTVWDASDSVVTSTVLIDAWEWLTEGNVVVATTFDP